MREVEILTLLADHSFMKPKELAENIGVSTRTIRNDIHELIQESNSFTIKCSRQLGYHLEVLDKTAYQEYIKQWQLTEVIESPSLRLDSLLVVLLLSNSYQTIDQLSYIFKLSSSQIKKDLNKLEHFLTGTPLQLERKAHYGIRIITDISNRLLFLKDQYRRKNQKLMQQLNQPAVQKIQKELHEIILSQGKKEDWELSLIEVEGLELEIILLKLVTENTLSLEKNFN